MVAIMWLTGERSRRRQPKQRRPPYPWRHRLKSTKPKSPRCRTAFRICSASNLSRRPHSRSRPGSSAPPHLTRTLQRSLRVTRASSGRKKTRSGRSGRGVPTYRFSPPTWLWFTADLPASAPSPGTEHALAVPAFSAPSGPDTAQIAQLLKEMQPNPISPVPGTSSFPSLQTASAETSEIKGGNKKDLPPHPLTRPMRRQEKLTYCSKEPFSKPFSSTVSTEALQVPSVPTVNRCLFQRPPASLDPRQGSCSGETKKVDTFGQNAWPLCFIACLCQTVFRQPRSIQGAQPDRQHRAAGSSSIATISASLGRRWPLVPSEPSRRPGPQAPSRRPCGP